MSGTDERLLHTAEQIARNFAIQGEARAALAVADHIATFWEPRMRERLLAMEPAGLGVIVAAAVAQLHSKGAPAHQTPATTPHGSDAG